MGYPQVYDLIIIGAGPAGLTASIYASCFHLKHLIIGKDLGGQLQFAPDILNYPGFLNISGKELTERLVEQVKKRGGEIVNDSVVKITHILTGPAARVSQASLQVARPDLIGTRSPFGEATLGIPSLASPVNYGINGFELETQGRNKYQARAIILATGTERRKLNVPGEIEYTGRDVHYCATCEKFDYEGKVCAVIGGANAAVQAAVEIAQAASRVYIIYRGSQLRGDPIWLDQVEKNPKIEVVYNTEVAEVLGDGEKVTGIKIKNSNSIKPVTSINTETMKLDKIFIEIGGVPGTALVIPLGVEMDPGGYIKVNARLATNVAGIFAAGDLVSYGLSIEQISSAVGLGARAAASAFAFLKQEKAPSVWGESRISR